MTQTPREHDLSIIAAHYGTDAGIGRDLLMEVASRYLLRMLPDGAIAELAQMHLENHHRQIRDMERRWRED